MRPRGAPRLPCGESRRWARPPRSAWKARAAATSTPPEAAAAPGRRRGSRALEGWSAPLSLAEPPPPAARRPHGRLGSAYAPTRLRAYAPTRLRAYAPTRLRAYAPTHLVRSELGPGALGPTSLASGPRPWAPGPGPGAGAASAASTARARKRRKRGKRRLRVQATHAPPSALCAQRVSGVQSAPAGGPVSSRALGNGPELPSSWWSADPVEAAKLP